MSLRTKLLAVVLGLNGAILLLVLFLLLRTEAQAPGALPSAALLDLLGLGASVAVGGEQAPPEPAALERARTRLRAVEGGGWIADLHVVEEGVEGTRVFTGEEFFSPFRPLEEVAEGPAREAVVQAFHRARQQQNRWIGPDWVAIAVTTEGPVRGLVARPAASAPARSGAREVYAVMVAGVLALSLVSWLLVSRWVVQPLKQITEAADRFAAGDYRQQVLRRGADDEFDRTIDAFNRMAAEIAEYQGHLEDRVLGAVARVRKAEQHLTIAQRLAATGKLAAGVAHEINNPLGGMRNAVRALSRGDLPEAKAAEYLDLIADGLARVEETVKKFLSFTPRQVEPRPTDLADVARKAIALARHRAERKQVAFEEDFPAEPATVYGDPHELVQVALNLLLNAVDAVPGDGSGRVRTSVRAEGGELVLAVADNGVGMTPEEQARCFDLFVTTKEPGEGSGLGLAVVHSVVTNHGGRVEVESRPGAGATFRVCLPTASRD
jgi:signal transduction histidine kinase